LGVDADSELDPTILGRAIRATFARRGAACVDVTVRTKQIARAADRQITCPDAISLANSETQEATKRVQAAMIRSIAAARWS